MSDSKAITINSSGELVEALVDDLVDKANINLTAAATMDLYSVTSNTVHISGSGAITSFGTPPRGGARRLVQFTSAGITLTHGTGAGSIRLPGLANIVTTLGDYAEFISTGSSAWICTSYTKLDGTALVSSGGGGGSSDVVTVLPDQYADELDLSGVTTEHVVVTIQADIYSVVLPAGTAGQAKYLSVTAIQGTAGGHILEWSGSGVTIEGGVAPPLIVGVGAKTEYILSNINNQGWRMYVDNGAPASHVGEGGSAHSLVTTGTAGFMSAADKVKLNALYTTVYDTVDVDEFNSTITPAVVMSVSLEANAIYEINCFLPFTSAAAATGIAVGFQGNVSGNYNLEAVVPIVNTAAASHLRKIFPNATETTTGEVLGTGVTAVNTVQTARISGTVKIGSTSGILSIRYRSETAGTAVTIKAGATLIARRVV